MKKRILTIGAAAFMVSAMLITSITVTPVAATAQEDLLPAGWVLMDGTCAPANTKHIKVCGAGTDASCTPEGTCP